MKIKLKTSDNNLDKFVGINESGHEIVLGMGGSAMGPMENVLVSLAGCSTIDVVLMLKKMRQELTAVDVEVTAKRREEIPRTFTDIHLHFTIKGKVKENKAEQAVESSMTKYCSVSKMLEKAATITSSFEVTE